MTHEDYEKHERLRMATRAFQRKHSYGFMRQAFRTRIMEDEFAEIGRLVLSNPSRREPHILVWAGYERATDSPYGVLI